MSLKRVIHLVDGLQRVTLKNNSVSTIAKATYRTAFIGSASMCGYLFSYWLSVTLRIDLLWYAGYQEGTCGLSRFL